MRSRCCLCVCLCTPIVARQRLGKSPLFVARQRLGKNPTIIAKQRCRGNECTRNNRRMFGRVVFNVARIVFLVYFTYFARGRPKPTQGCSAEEEEEDLF
jgi:hypothetical protein